MKGPLSPGSATFGPSVGRWSFGAVTVGILLILSGCHSAGKDFKRPEESSLVLGQTTIAVAIDKQGPPAGRVVRHSLNPAPSYTPPGNQPPGFKPASVGGTIETLTYKYSYTAASGIIVGPLNSNSKRLTLSFWDDHLVFYNFESGFSADSTKFDDKKVSTFVVGRTTSSDVIQDLGRPSGEGIYPFVAKEGTKMLVYEYVSTESSGWVPRGETVTTRKTARLLFDPSDRLIDSYKQTTFSGR